LINSEQRNVLKTTAVLIILMAGLNIVYAASAIVVGVYDADLLNIEDHGEETRIRLYGVDAPEAGQNGNVAAIRFLRRMVLDHPVTVKVIETDRLNQIFAVVVREGKESSVNAAIVANGYAWVNRDRCRADECEVWKAMENRARTLKLGIWSDYNVMPPWEFREQQRKQ
jgi:endonuclease YncB( thermonuclease family)